MKKLILIILSILSIQGFSQIQYNTARKLVYVRTCNIHGKKPLITDLSSNIYGYNSADSVWYSLVNGVVTATDTYYPYSAGKKKLVGSVSEAVAYKFSTVKKMYYFLYNDVAGNKPITADFPTSIYRCVNTTDSLEYDKYNGIVRTAFVRYPYQPYKSEEVTPELPELITRIYVSSEGNDGNTNPHNPNTPYATTAKINDVMTSLNPNDSILFRAGDTFIGNIKIARSNIYIGSYGEGAKPIITGLNPITAWTNLGGNIWESSVTACKSTLNLITVDGKIAQIGRYPNSTFLTYESFASTVSITDNQLTASPNWTGAEVLIRNNGYGNQRRIITNHSGTVIIYAGGNNYDMHAGYGYFIQNDVRTLDADKEWYFNTATKKIRMYFADNNPSLHSIKASIYDTIVLATSRNYITLENLRIEGGNEANIDLNGTSTGCNVLSCDLNYSGTFGAYIGTVSNFLFSGNTISNSLTKGLLVQNTSTNTIFEYNTISKSGMIVGMNRLYYPYTGFEISGAAIGAIIRYNTIDSSGYHGIFPRGSNNIIQNNLITNFGMTLDDCGGIYMNTVQPGNKLLGNIILNGIGNYAGTNYTVSHAEGIYLDEVSANTYMEGNTIAHCGSSGIRYHNAYNITARENTMYDNAYNVHIIKSNPNVAYSQNLVFKSNIMVAKTAPQYTFRIYNYISDNPLLFGTADSNYYCRPIAEGSTIQTRNVSTIVNYTLATWKTATGGDVHSYSSPFAATEFLFEYATSTVRTISLTGAWKTLANASVSGSITLQPYTSIILIR